MFLIDIFERQLQDTELDIEFRSLFYGEKENVIKCNNIAYENASRESFTQLEVHLQESDTLEASLKNLFQAEELTGENQYSHETKGKQDAKKFTRISKLPPVLQININRFGVDKDGYMTKIDSRCEFGDTLDIDKIMEGTDSFTLS